MIFFIFYHLSLLLSFVLVIYHTKVLKTARKKLHLALLFAGIMHFDLFLFNFELRVLVLFDDHIFYYPFLANHLSKAIRIHRNFPCKWIFDTKYQLFSSRSFQCILKQIRSNLFSVIACIMTQCTFWKFYYFM